MKYSDVNLEDLLRYYLRASPRVMLVLEAAREARLASWRLFSGAVYQTVWNALTGRPPDYGIRDYDVGYFDIDISVKAERIAQARVLQRVPEPTRSRVEVANQARVHLWFKREFGRPYSALQNTDEALGRSLFWAHAVGVRLEPDGSLTVCAPYGLEDVFDLVLRPNPELELDAVHAEKAQEVIERWPEVTVV